MAGNAISDGLGFAAAATLGKATGTDFLGPALEDIRQRDRFVFQRRQLEDAANRERKRETKERTENQRGLLKSLQAVGAFNEEDFIAVGGADGLAGLDSSGFQVAISQMSSNKNRRLSLDERRQVIIARAAARGFTVHPDADERTLLEVDERLNLLDLDKEDAKERQGEARFAATAKLNATQAAFEDKLADPTQVTTETAALMTSQLDVDARAVASDPDLSVRDREVLLAQHQNNVRAAQRAAKMAEATDIANSSQANILKAWTDNPTARTYLQAHRSVQRALVAAEGGAEFVLELDDAEAADLGLSSLQQRMRDNGGASSIETDGDIAADAAAVSGKLGEYRKKRAERKDKLSAVEKAQDLTEAVRSVLPAASFVEVNPMDHIEGGKLNLPAFANALLSPMAANVEAATPAKLAILERQLSRTGLPVQVIGPLQSRIAARQMEAAQVLDPKELRAAAYAVERMDYDAVSAALTAVPVGPGDLPTSTSVAASLSLPGTSALLHRRLQAARVANPEWVSGMHDAFRNLDASLNQQFDTANNTYETIKSRAGEFSNDPDTHKTVTEYADGMRVQALNLQFRIQARQMIAGALSGLTLSSTDETANGLFAMSGGKSAETEKQKALQQRLSQADTTTFLLALQESLGANLNEDAKRALGAEISMLEELMKNAATLFEGEDGEEIIGTLTRSGIISARDSDFPEVEVVRYFLAN